MRRVAMLFFVAFALMLTALPAGAGRPVESTESWTTVWCSAESEVGRVEAGVDTNGFESFGWFAVWEDEGEEPSLATVGEGDQIVFGDDTASLTAEVYDLSTWEPAGSVEVEFVYEVGDTWPIDERFREGNRWVELHGTESTLMASGTASLVLDGEDPVAIEMTECSGAHADIQRWETNPNAYVGSGSGEWMTCSVPLTEGVVELGLYGDEYGGGADLWVIGPGGWEEPPIYYGWAPYPGVDPGPVDVEFEMFDGETGDPIDPATLEGYVSAGDTVRSRIYSQGGKSTTVETLLTMTGTLTLPYGDEVALDGYCEGGVYRSKDIWTQPHGPKPSGAPPVNDLPDGAVALLRGDNAQTKGAAWEPEATCVQEWEEETWEIPLGKTVWYTIRGTGDEVTVSTTGTHFDTVLAVYDSEMGQIACVDDVLDGVFSLQAEVTFPTETGETYLVQAGGFGGQYGLLKLTRP